MNRIPLLIGVSSFVIYRFALYMTNDFWISLLVVLIPLGLIFLGFFFRKNLYYSILYLSPKNIFVKRTTHSIQSEISTDLLIEKLIEVIEFSKFSLFDADKTNLIILCGTSVNFWTWGENIYIQLEATNDGTNIKFTSVTLFGNQSWGRNDKNFDLFFESFESSLIV